MRSVNCNGPCTGAGFIPTKREPEPGRATVAAARPSPGPNDVRLSKFLDGAMELQPLRFKVDAASGRNDVTRMKGWRPDYRDYRGFPYVPERMGSPLRNEVHRT